MNGTHLWIFSISLMLNFTLTLIHAPQMKTINVISISPKKLTVFPRSGGGYRVFCNPPYGRTIGEWVKKSYEESKQLGTIVVMLIPARTDTKWFHEYIYGKAEIRFIRDRLKFGGCKNAAPFPSMVVIFKGEEQ